ncbi:MAG: alkaline phosphatase family protein [Deltaproteobacteria bacterium]|nr:alkaline phosphatase family protein [Deltaproteobacteria bacterium]MDQ3296943.1 alkaline phosphatase family protein [Myxococcota bacterium]
MRLPARCALLIAAAGCPAPQVSPPRVVPPPADAAVDTPVPPVVTPAAPGEAPRLVVLVVVDQLPSWAFAIKRPHLTGGFDRLLREGEWHTGVHPSAATLTAPGHALISSGEPTATSGILGNEWWHRDVGRVVGSVEAHDGSSSAVWMRVPALGDALVAGATGGKAVSVGLKGRAAILLLGKAGLPIWYDRKLAAFKSFSTPGWLADHGRQHPILPRLDDVWTPRDPAQLARISQTTDDQRGEVGSKGFGPTFPHAPRKTASPADTVFALPLGNELVFETALAAIAGEALGSDAAPDLLALSLSAYDYVGHGWGQESWEAWDMMLRLDQQLAGFLAALDRRVGVGRWSLVLTSDHGACPLPERGNGGRLAFETIKNAANRAAAAELGPGEWVVAAKYPSVYLSAAARAKPPKELAKATTKIIHALRSFPGLERVERTADFAGNCARRTGDALMICLGLDAERSGEIFYLPRAGWVLHEKASPPATAHGSQHAYDREVPVIVLASDRAAAHPPLATPSTTPMPMVQISKILAGWLGITPPSALPRAAP